MLPLWIVLLAMLAALVGLPLLYATRRPEVRTPLLLGHIAVLQVIPGTLMAPYAFPLPGGLLLTPANLIVSAVFLAAVVLILVERRANVVRLAILATVVAGLIELGVLASTHWLLASGAVEPFLTVDADTYGSFLHSLLAGTPLVVLELLLFVVVTERLGSVMTQRRRAAVAYVGVFVATLALDGVLFPLATSMLEPGLGGEIAGGVASKLVIAAALGLPLLAFVLLREDDIELGQTAPPLSLRDVLFASRRQLVARLERREQERIDLLERTLHVAEDERQRLAEDLHDDAIQLLTAADIRLQHVAASTPGLDVDTIRDLIQNGVGSLRRLILELRGPDVTATNFEPLVLSYIERLVPEGTWDVEVEIDLQPDLGTEVLAGAYRIVLEAVANAAKHAEADRVVIRVRIQEDTVVGSVVDDGTGIPAHVETGPGHLGLRAMHDRAGVLGGDVEVRAVNPGTAVAFRLPLTHSG